MGPKSPEDQSAANTVQPQGPGGRYVPPPQQRLSPKDPRWRGRPTNQSGGKQSSQERGRARSRSSSSHSFSSTSSRSPSPHNRRPPPRARPYRSYPASRSRSASRSPSPCPHSRRDRPSSPREEEDDEDKPWFKKKTVWATIGTLAAVAALGPAAVSAHASQEAARASQKSSQAAQRSANAVVNTTIANGHMDKKGRYTGPRAEKNGPRKTGGHSSSRVVRHRTVETAPRLMIEPRYNTPRYW